MSRDGVVLGLVKHRSSGEWRRPKCILPNEMDGTEGAGKPSQRMQVLCYDYDAPLVLGCGVKVHHAIS